MRTYSDADGYLSYAKLFIDKDVKIRDTLIYPEKHPGPVEYYYGKRFLLEAVGNDRLVTASPDGKIHSIDTGKNEPAKERLSLDHGIAEMVFSDNQNSLYVATISGDFLVIDTSSWSIKKRVKLHSFATSIVDLPEKNEILLGHWNGDVSFRNNELKREARILPIFKMGCVKLKLFDERGGILSTSADGRILRLSLTGKVEYEFDKKKEKGNFHLIETFEDQPIALIGGWGNFDKLNQKTLKRIMPFKHAQGRVTALDISPQKDSFAVAYAGMPGPRLFIRDMNNFNILKGNFVGHKGHYITDVKFSQQSENILFSIGDDGHVRKWDINNLKELQNYKVSDVKASELDFDDVLSTHVRQPGYPFLMSLFMRITGLKDSSSATLVQSFLLTFMVGAFSFFLLKKVGFFASLIFLLIFLDPTNDIKLISYLEMTDFVLMIFSMVITFLLIKVYTEESGRFKNTAILILTLFISMFIKVNMASLYLLISGSLFVSFFIRALYFKKFHLIKQYSALTIFLMVTGVSLIFFNQKLSPGAFKFNNEAVSVKLYRKSVLDIPDFPNKRILQLERALKQFKSQAEYSGANRLTATNSWPEMYRFLPVIGKYPIPMRDPVGGDLIEVSRDDFYEGVKFLSSRLDVMEFFKVGWQRLFKDYPNALFFSHVVRARLPLLFLNLLVLVIGVVLLLRRSPWLVGALIFSYGFYSFYLSVATVLSSRLMLVFVPINYIFLITGILYFLKKILQLFKIELNDNKWYSILPL